MVAHSDVHVEVPERSICLSEAQEQMLRISSGGYQSLFPRRPGIDSYRWSKEGCSDDIVCGQRVDADSERYRRQDWICEDKETICQ